MKGLENSFKKLLGNKNTVTILGVIVCIIVLYVGYNFQISRRVQLVDMPVAAETIGPRTLIETKMVQKVRVPKNLLQGEFYNETKDIVGKYTNFSATVAKGSLFYKALLIKAEDLASSMFKDVPEGYVVVNYPVDMNTTYSNAMEPDTYINIYFKALNIAAEESERDEEDSEKVIFGKFIQNIKVLAVRDSEGKSVYEASEEVRKPSNLYFAIPEDMFDLLNKALYISKDYGIELKIVPNTVELTEKDVVQVSSEDIKNFIVDRTETIDINIDIDDDSIIDIEKYKEEYSKKIADAKSKKSDKKTN